MLCITYINYIFYRLKYYTSDIKNTVKNVNKMLIFITYMKQKKND